MPTTLLMLLPQTPTTRAWAAQLGAALPQLSVVVAETETEAAKAVGGADAAFGTMPDALVRDARRLRWLQAPQAAPPAGYYTPALIGHPVVVTNFREIYNDHIGAHILAFVLAFARGLHQYLPQQLEPVWRPPPLHAGVHGARGGGGRHWRGGRAARRRLRDGGDRGGRAPTGCAARHGGAPRRR